VLDLGFIRDVTFSFEIGEWNVLGCQSCDGFYHSRSFRHSFGLAHSAGTAERRVSGSTGVNRFFGGLAKEKQLFGPLGMTRKAGPPEAMAAEAAGF